MEEIMHITAQYLATAAISFLPKKEDDSHTNLGWINHTLETHPFENGDKLALNYENFSLEWIQSNGNKERLFLNKLKHKDIIHWIAQVSINNDIEKTYSYAMHYDLPYKKILDTTRFELTNQNDLNQLIKNRDLAQHVISSILKSSNFKSSIRIWPHHFDTGTYVNVNDQLSIGIGMAIPDSLINDFYFYVSGYRGGDAIKIKSDINLTHGNYYHENWQGFALPLQGIDEAIASDFCQLAIDTYLAT